MRYCELAGSTTTLTAAVLGLDVVGRDVAVEEHLVAHARAATGAHGDTQDHLRVALGVEQLLDLVDAASVRVKTVLASCTVNIEHVLALTTLG